MGAPIVNDPSGISSNISTQNSLSFDLSSKHLSKIPSKRPTKSPTKSPSKRPTKSPSKSPSKNPTKSPTKSPTKGSSKISSNSSSKGPSKIQTKSPTSKKSSNSVNGPPSEAPSIWLKSIPLLESLGHPGNSSNLRQTEKENSSLQDLYIVDMQSSSHLSENAGINKRLHSKTNSTCSNEDLFANECSTYNDDHSIFSNENNSNDRIFMVDDSSLLSELQNIAGMNDSNHASLSLLEMKEDDSDFYEDEDSSISTIADEENFVCDIPYNSSNETIFLEDLVDTDDWVGIDITDSLSCSSNRMPGYDKINNQDQQAAESISILRQKLRRIEKNYSKKSIP